MTICKASTSQWENAGAADTTRSPNAVMRPVPVHAVEIDDGFWKPWLDANRTQGIFSFLNWLDEDDQVSPFREFAHFARTGDASRIDDGLDRMRRAYEGKNNQRLRHTWRATVMEVVEACAYILQSGEHTGIRALMDELVTGIVAAHASNEFLLSYYGENFEHSYQLGTPGHLFQAAVAHHRVTGETDFLNIAVTVADSIAGKFKGRAFAEHPGIEMALVELYRATGEKRILELATHFVGLIMEQPPVIGPDTGEGHWRHFNRHVVRQTYLCCGTADLLAEISDPALLEHLLAIWEDMNAGKIHITGQLATDYWLGERITNEPFAISTGVFGCLQDHIIHGFELCEAVGNIMWNWRMLTLTADTTFFDLLERTLYNGLLSHISLDHRNYHYLSLMASDGDHPPRNPWGNPTTGCCPANAVRFMPSIPSYFFSTSNEGVWVHLYDNCKMDWHLPDGRSIILSQRTRYPWDGTVTVEIGLREPAEFSVHLRIPSWCEHAVITINGRRLEDSVERGTYHRICRVWRDSDVITVTLRMPVVAMEADPRAHEFRDKVAVMRGPLLYCFEGVDNPDYHIRTISIPATGERIRPFGEGIETEALYHPATELSFFEPIDKPDLLGGVTVLKGPTQNRGKSKITAIPYYAWANRTQSSMRIWIDRMEASEN